MLLSEDRPFRDGGKRVLARDGGAGSNSTLQKSVGDESNESRKRMGRNRETIVKGSQASHGGNF